MQVEATLMAIIAATAGWLAIGGVGYSPWASQDVRIGLVVVFCLMQAVGFIFTFHHDPQAVYAAGAAIGMTITTLVVLLVNTGVQNFAQGFFWALSGLYFGLFWVFIAKLVIERRRLRAENALRNTANKC
ncbi:hypothetical protein CSOJ01_03952 [Colletotrichum sojae]|uniref:Uncharacterized protein n=1 Tax=Colletotrichum sojae TaxID=2175907 RepID=A0A8H6MZF5_9PEZI|nr:hypothetical protein CSOJ01_03952 [Colletotrichum sojae]